MATSASQNRSGRANPDIPRIDNHPLLNMDWEPGLIDKQANASFEGNFSFRSEIGSIEVGEQPFTRLGGKVTVDFWDTLVGRTTPAESIKQFTAMISSFELWGYNSFRGRRPSSKAILSRRLESESKQVDILGEACLYKSIYESLPDSCANRKLLTELLVREELQMELSRSKWLGLEEFIPEELLSSADVLSDFYMNEQYLRQIQNHVSPFKMLGLLKTSCSAGRTKRSGKLFDDIASNHKDWIHIGDNPVSDFEIPQKLGAETIFVKRVPATSWNGHDSESSRLVKDLQKHLNLNDESLLSLQIALIGYSLITFALEKAIETGKTTIVFVSREGETLSNIYRILFPRLRKKGLPEISGVHLPVSRSSVFFPSHSENVEGGLRRLSSKFPTMTLQALKSSFGDNPSISKEFDRVFTKNSRVRTEEVWGSLTKASQAVIISELRSQNDLIRKYLEQKDIDLKSSIIVDLGWSGTIQDSLSSIAGERVQGVYLGVRKSDLKNERDRYGLLFDEIEKRPAPDYFNFVGPLERAFTPRSHSGKHALSKEGVVEFSASSVDDGASASRDMSLNNNLPRIVDAVMETVFAIGLFGSDCRDFTQEVVRLWFQDPTSHHAELWFGEMHDEGFGIDLQDVHYEKSLRRLEKSSGPSKTSIKTSILLSQWPEGYVMWKPVRMLWDRGIVND